MHVPLLDLRAQYDAIRDEIEPSVREVFESQQFILGPKVKKFEDEVAQYCGAGRAVGCASGTDALLLALMALGTGPGDEVITTPYTFFATGGSIARLGARIVFIDIRSDTYNMNSDLLENAITERTKAVIPVHLFGLVAEMDRINEICGSRGIPVIEDAAQAIGATAPFGKAGSIGTMGCFSFFPSKNLGGAGDGGMVVTNDNTLADKLSILNIHGSKPKYYHKLVGINSRLDALQAVVLQVKLRYLDSWSVARRTNALRYNRLFAERGLEGIVSTPVIPDGYGHIFNQYVIRAKDRDAMKDYLGHRDIGTEIYYPVPLHLQECFVGLGYREGDMPESEEAAKTTLALPIYPELSEEMQDYVVDTITAFSRR